MYIHANTWWTWRFEAKPPIGRYTAVTITSKNYNNNNTFYLIWRHIQFQIVPGTLHTLKYKYTPEEKIINILVTYINNDNFF